MAGSEFSVGNLVLRFYPSIYIYIASGYMDVHACSTLKVVWEDGLLGS